ncbi:MAG: YjdF family protein [Oscillospiraceae bacterium]
MQKNESRLTVFFDDPFWVGIIERFSESGLEVCRVTFGAEPKDGEVYGFFLNNYNGLSFSPPVKAEEKSETKINPKRMRREISRQLDTRGVGTKSQQALKLQQESGKLAKKENSKQRREEEKQLKFELRQRKQKEKHRGR